MRKSVLACMAVSGILAVGTPLFAAGTAFAYKFKAGQTWLCTQSNLSESVFMGQKHVNRGKKVVEYTVSKGPKKGWLSLSARIRSQSAPDGASPMDVSKMKFSADIHSSGEIRNIKSSGNPMEQNMAGVPPEMKAMMESSVKMVADAWKHAVFWFPEFPEEKLGIGDEFEVERDLGMGGATMQTKSVSRQVFTLEEVSGDLAYFSVKQRSVTKSEGAMGGKSKTRIAGKGDAIFDLKTGMWVELSEKMKAKVELAGIPGMEGSSQDMKILNKYEMQRK